MFAKNTKKNTDGQITNVICNSAKQGLIPQREYFDKDIANSDNTSGYYIIEQNDFVYNPRKSSDAPYGPISSYKYPDAGIVSPLYLCFRAKEKINPSFFEWYFRSSAWHRYVYMSGDSGARHDRVSIKDDVFFAMPISIPSAREQEHIASFLDMIDQRIDKQRALVDNLKKYKRGVSTYLFDSNCSHPKSSPIWSKVRINDIASIFIGEFVIKTKQSPSAPYPVYNGGTSFTGLYDDYNQEGNRVLVSARGANAGFVNKVNGKCWIGNSCYAISLFENAPIFFDYLYHYLKFNQGKLIESQQSANIPSISKKQLQDFNVEFPDLNAQQEIVQFLNCLDAKINYEEKKFSAFGSLRLGLLQQLFI